MNKIAGVVWITGIPGAGKSTLATALVAKLQKLDITPVLLDGDTLRSILNNYEYQRESRQALALSYSKLAKEFAVQGHIVVVSTVSMFDCVREFNREQISSYCEVYLEVSEQELFRRDQKGLFSQAQAKQADNVPGVNLAIELPKHPDITLSNAKLAELEGNVEKILQKISGW